MRLTQGTFSFLPDLTDEQIAKQIDYAIGRGWAIGIEHTTDPHPRNTYWEMFGMPAFDLADASGVMPAVRECRASFPESYVRVNAFDPTPGWETVRLSFIVHRPTIEPGFHLERQEGEGRIIRYVTRSYSVENAENVKNVNNPKDVQNPEKVRNSENRENFGKFEKKGG